MTNLPFSGQQAPPFDQYLLSTYRASEYACKNFRLRPGQQNEQWAEYLAAHCHSSFTFITAYNPYSRSGTTLPENLGRASKLRRWVDQHGYTYLPAAGIDPRGEWPEEIGVMIVDLPLGQALALGAGFGQHAILHGGTDAIPAILWCQCKLP